MVIFKDRFWVGASYRTGIKLFNKNFEQGQQVSSANSISGLAQFFVNDTFRIGYSYDYSMSDLQTFDSGSHELTLGLSIPPKIFKVLSPRFF